MSTSNPNSGAKVKGPSSTIREHPGPIAADSLAAESSRAHGVFAENPDSNPLGVSGASSTFLNTDVSGATRLDPASDAEARKAQEDWAQEKHFGSQTTSYPTALGGQRASATGFGGYVAGRADTGEVGGGVAPSYVSSQFMDTAGPKGANLTEGGFKSDDSKNASFNSEIGQGNDPGRLAELKFQRQNADTAGNAALPTQKGGLGENPYEELVKNASA